MGDLIPWSDISALGLQLLQLPPDLTQTNIFVQAVIFLQNLLVLVRGFMGNQLCLVLSDPERLLYIHTLSNKYGNADGLGHAGDKQKWWETEIPKSPSPGLGFVKTASLVYRMFLHHSSKESWTSEWIDGLMFSLYYFCATVFSSVEVCYCFLLELSFLLEQSCLAVFSDIPFHYLSFRLFLSLLNNLVHFQGILFIFPAICF